MAIESTSKMKCKSCVSYTTRLSLVSSIYDPLALFYRNTMQQMRLVISAFLQRGKSVAEMAKHSRLQIATFLHRWQVLRIRRHTDTIACSDIHQLVAREGIERTAAEHPDSAEDSVIVR